MIIAFSGPRRAGKTTAANYLSRAYGATQLSMAAPVKDMLRVLLQSYNIVDTDRYLYGDLKEEPIPSLNGKTARYLMETLATEWGRDLIMENVWVDAAKNTMLRNPRKLYVFDDLRLDNERNFVLENGGTIVEIVGRGEYKKEHRSDFGGAYDMVLDNSQTIVDFYRNLDDMMSFVKPS